MRLTLKKIHFLIVENFVLLSFLGTLFFFSMLIYGIPKMTPYPANPFFLFSFFAFFSYLGIKYIGQEKNKLAINSSDVLWLVVANMSAIFWAGYLHMELKTVYSYVYSFLVLVSLICWIGYLFASDTVRIWLKSFAGYLLITAIIYYLICPFSLGD